MRNATSTQAKSKWAGDAYQHYIPAANLVPAWKDHIEFNLIESLDELKSVLLSLNNYVAWDLETSGLNPEESHIVGIAFADAPNKGYYVPVKHAIGTSLGPQAVQMFHKMLLTRRMTFLYNAKFDIRFMEHAGYPCDDLKFFDVMVSCWLSDTNNKNNTLKWYERHFLGWQPETFEEVLGNVDNFFYLDPKDCYHYAVTDAVGTFALVSKTMQFHNEAKGAAKIDQEAIYPLMKLEQDVIPLDADLLASIQEEITEQINEAKHLIYQMAGTPVKINSGRDMTSVFERLGIDTGKRTKTGYMVLNEDALDNTFAHNPHPILKQLIAFRKHTKALSAYIEPLLDGATNPRGGVRFGYRLTAVPTGRLACGDKHNSYFTPVNVQAIPKPSSTNWYVRKATQAEIDSKQDILGWYFSQDEKTDFMVEGYSQKHNLRAAFKANPDEYFVSCDMAGEELRIAANHHMEPLWIDAFLHNKDIHKETALKVWGEENYSKDKRAIAKTLNFGLLYGMSAHGLRDRFPGMTIDEAEQFVESFKAAIPHIISGQQRDIIKAKKTGTIYNYLGRPRRLQYYFNHPDSAKRSFGYRSVQNSPIQSIGGDIIKMALRRIYENLFKPAKHKVRFIATVHDEIDLCIERARASEILPIVIKAMTFQFPNWPVPFVCGLDVGRSWGELFSFEYDLTTGEYTPIMFPAASAPSVVSDEANEVPEISFGEDDFLSEL